MAQQNSFDIVSKVDLAEVKNAVNQAMKEIQQRYDLKGTGSEIRLLDKESRLVTSSQDEFTLKAAETVLQQKLVRRSVSLRALTWGTVEPAAGGTVRREVEMQQGIPIEKAREIVKLVKRAKLKVQAAIQDDMVRISGKNRDDLQAVIALVKDADLGIDMQFTNYRSL